MIAERVGTRWQQVFLQSLSVSLMSVIESAIMTVNVSASDSAQRHCDDDEPDVRLLCAS